MPISLTLTEGALPSAAISDAIARITEAFLKAHGLSGNKAMTPNVTAHVHVMPKGSTYSGGKAVDGAWIEIKTPSFALIDRQAQRAFFGDATDALLELSSGALSRDRIWSDGVHAVDGTWNFNGVAMTNEELGAELAKG